ncbi:NADP-dependent oxidoreductase domain-containing protein [Cokeromyces recurvatus]|uniref:NADP-dependent oxidoreductase domain-containing protein n=1 Tax=Cokeromyces recurvatus TaxID=90255 RepID=UPI00221EE825|nr:NADP-dependent oxidoreductase domain-containing protein [Cokeromyces recurvatus]KAI7899003.1 NADP-dependent oxidoreductase domain-containing protein [Cokeromyces recurvatus]
MPVLVKQVSQIALNCVSYGSSKSRPWVKDEEESLRLIGKAYEAGINFFDTADAYSNGESERILGKAIKIFDMDRGRIVIATKCFFAVSKDISTNTLGLKSLDDDSDSINNYGLSRKHIFDAVDASLRRLGVDYIDLYQIHRFDHHTPIEETMEALNDLVRSGKVRYIGCSSCYTWEFQKANTIAERHGWTRFVSMQNCYNLLYREEEREMFPYCLDSGIACIPWSPLARGLLTGKSRQSVRLESDRGIQSFFLARRASESNEAIIDRVVKLAERLGHSPAQVALAWMLTKSYCTAPIVGIGKEENLYDVIGALDVILSEEDVKYLEEPYVPHKVQM